MTDLARAVKISRAAITINLVLASIKLSAGWLGHSSALVADGIESFTDVFSTLIVLSGLHFAGKPADEEHPYGHGKAEPIAGLLVLSLLFAAAFGIAWRSLHEIQNPTQIPEPFTVAILILVITIKEILFRISSKASRSTGSGALMADAWHHRSDAISSFAALIGILLAIYAGPRFKSADAWAALISCLVIAWSGVEVGRGLFDQFMDASVPRETLDGVRKLAADVPGVRGIDKCRVRKSGLNLTMDIHILVNGNISVREGHDISHHVKDRLMESPYRISDVTVHIEPAER